MPSNIVIGDRIIGSGNKPFIIAEMSGNHNQSLARALAIVEAAAQSGADALKLQTYTADTMTLDLRRDEFLISDPRSLWHGKSLYQLYQEAHTPWNWHEIIFKRCRELGIVGFSTPFDETAVDFLESSNVSAYKVASFENTDLPLIRKIAATGRPMIISTGMATAAEIAETIATARTAGCSDIVLLKCTSSYPASPSESNLRTIPDLQKRFNVQVGLSDHTLGTAAAVASVALGAVVIEKHFTLSRAEGGPDAAFSLEPAELTQLVSDTKSAWEALGNVSYGTSELEKRSLQFRRSTYVVREIKAGETFTKMHLRAIRPGFGLPPKYTEEIIGRRASRDVTAGTPLTAELVEGLTVS
jgi:N-acetylneuraminate synthase